MPEPVFTLSGASRAALCPGSMALPTTPSASQASDVGSAGHEHTQIRLERGLDAADAAFPEIAEAWELSSRERAVLRARLYSWEPPVGPGPLCEVPLALLEDGTVRRVKGGRGSYAAEDGILFAGTLDVAWAEPEPLQHSVEPGREDAPPPRVPVDAVAYVADWKFGSEEHVPPARRNLQVRLGAMLFARWTSARRVVPMIVYPGPDAGEVDLETDGAGRAVALTEPDLAALESYGRALVARGLEQRRRLAEGQPLDLVTGAHCLYCPARSACPAHIAEVRALATGALDVTPGRPLTREEATRLAGLLAPADAVLRRAREALKAYADEHGPIELPDGRVWGPVDVARDELDAGLTLPALTSALAALVRPDRAAELALGAMSVSKEAIKDALRVALAEAGVKRQLGKRFGAVLDALRAGGGLSRKAGVEYRVHRLGERAAPADDASEAP
ncbi:hypothetical protein [Sorangium sp. So ce233]|uniref:hypothetical protein n=1 Tax=Sorangium sp. So ce233 TaxID=3133290 RepID=UPI003F63CF30